MFHRSMRVPSALVAALSCWLMVSTDAAETPRDAPTPASRLPIEAFSDLPMIEGPRLSPDGRHVAAFVNRDGQTLLVTSPLAPLKLKALLTTDNLVQQFEWVHWVGNDRVVVGVRIADHRGSNDTVETRLLSVPLDGSPAINLMRSSPFDDAHVWPAQFQDDVIDWLPDDGEHVLVALPTASATGLATSVVRVDVRTGGHYTVKTPERDIRTWITDETHRVRVGVKQHGADVAVLICDPDGSHWHTAWSYKMFDVDQVTPLGFGADPNLLYLAADNDGRRAVFRTDLRDPALPLTRMLPNTKGDLAGELLHDPRGGAAVGVHGARLGHGDQLFWDPTFQQLARQIDAGLPERSNRIVQFADDGDHYLVHSGGNGIPGEFYVGSRATAQVDLVGEEHPNLPPASLAKKSRVTFLAQDGLRLQAFMTLPIGVSPNHLPTVLLPHGGPQGGDSELFDLWSEFLANRGYAVLQINFRGSVGEGHALMSAGLRRWGLEMQDDLTDGVHWLIDQGIADPRRIAIVGGSYGGYAALMGAVKTPDLYRAVVSFAGIGDLIDLARHEARYVDGSEVFERQVGSAWSDADRLKATSPRRLAAAVKAPVLLIHGTLDRSVPFSQSEDMDDALKAAGKRVRFVRQREGDHYLSSQRQRLEFFRELETFLDRELAPVRSDPP